jgi:hypothetical protein
MLKMRIVTLATAGALIAALLPLSAFAHDNSSDHNRDNGHKGPFVASFLNAFHHRDHDEDRDKDEEKNDNDEHDKAAIRANLFFGTVTDVDGSNVTFMARNGEEFTMDVTGVKVVRLAGDDFVSATLEVGDKILVGGSARGSVITATVVRDLSQNQPNKVKGKVTAVSGNTITVQTKHNGTQDVTTNASTTIILDTGLPGSLTDIIVNSMIKANGSWSGDVFTAALIKIR